MNWLGYVGVFLMGMGIGYVVALYMLRQEMRELEDAFLSARRGQRLREWDR